eukprot:TRINITY_DN40163_c0_g1_i1.p1 TRINITY_DN40163_c0_g1~~TRINITY_DN40163_c0_g1_i1.p1  ORF type:complete len:163 (+),score=45.70 TRINITY_DN40163_c0_g1_i1:53-490(+)
MARALLLLVCCTAVSGTSAPSAAPALSPTASPHAAPSCDCCCLQGQCTAADCIGWAQTDQCRINAAFMRSACGEFCGVSCGSDDDGGSSGMSTGAKYAIFILTYLASIFGGIYGMKFYRNRQKEGGAATARFNPLRMLGRGGEEV